MYFLQNVRQIGLNFWRCFSVAIQNKKKSWRIKKGNTRVPSNFVTCVTLIYSVARVVFPCYRMNTQKHMNCHLFQLVLFDQSDNKSYFELIRPGVSFADQWLRQGNKSMASGLWGAHSWEANSQTTSLLALDDKLRVFDIETAVQRNKCVHPFFPWALDNATPI